MQSGHWVFKAVGHIEYSAYSEQVGAIGALTQDTPESWHAGLPMQRLARTDCHHRLMLCCTCSVLRRALQDIG
eukprot:3534794-Alexandrium_andersonii.AAC.1